MLDSQVGSTVQGHCSTNETTKAINDLPLLSINQSNFYSANIPGEARLSGTTAESVFNSKIEETVP